MWGFRQRLLHSAPAQDGQFLVERCHIRPRLEATFQACRNHEAGVKRMRHRPEQLQLSAELAMRVITASI